MIRIDLGAGRVKRPGYLSADRQWNKGIYVVCDVEKGLPFLDDSIEVFSRHLFEHINNLIQLFEEVHRVCKPGVSYGIQ